MDRYFGTTVFSKTQDAFQHSFYYLPTGQTACGWSGLDGGIEGLNQYTWMLDYTAQMRHALSKFGIMFKVMSYGDDYKAAVLITPNQSTLNIKSLKEEIVKSVTGKVSKDFGHPLKEFDSYGSQVFLSFCKNSSINGIGLPQTVRKIQKYYASGNTFMPTLDVYVSSAFSNGHPAFATSPSCYPAYIVAL